MPIQYLLPLIREARIVATEARAYIVGMNVARPNCGKLEARPTCWLRLLVLPTFVLLATTGDVALAAGEININELERDRASGGNNILTADPEQAEKMSLQAVKARRIGVTVAVQLKVTGSLNEALRKLREGDGIHANEVVETAPEALGEFELNDKTKLALGPGSKLVLDKFVYDPNKGTARIALNLAKGAFRFMTGNSPKAAYQIKLPSASLTVRGTIFDAFVDARGEVALLLIEGAVEICARGTCKLHDEVGWFVHVGRSGRISGPSKWDGSFWPGASIQAAFPFVGRRLVIDQVLHFQYADLYGGMSISPPTRPDKPNK